MEAVVWVLGDFVVGKTKEEALDALTARLCMIPESSSFLGEELSKERVFRRSSGDGAVPVFGEPIPFLWPAPELRQWAIDRGDTMIDEKEEDVVQTWPVGCTHGR